MHWKRHSALDMGGYEIEDNLLTLYTCIVTRIKIMSAYENYKKALMCKPSMMLHSMLQQCAEIMQALLA